MIRNKERGITLIALVITIIVLLILAGVALSALTGDSGILNNAEKAKEQTSLANAKEQVALAVQGALIQGVSEGVGEITYSNLDKELKKLTDTYSISGEQEGPWIVTVNEYIVEITKKGINKILLANKNGTTPWLPTGFSKVKGTSLLTGLTIANTADGTPGTQNYVWIEVPKTISASITRDEVATRVTLADAQNESEILEILEVYAGKGTTTNYRNDSYKDEWYDYNGKNASTSTKLEDTDGCGMTKNEYEDTYEKMLNSIKKYGGFWLAQYEAGIAYDEGNRTTDSERITNNPKSANYAKDQYPYNYVYCSEAQKIANQDSTQEYTSSLPFGIQWDLVCKFLEVNKAKTYDEIAKNSLWGNYNNLGWTSSTNSKYSDNQGASFTPGAKEKSSGSYLLTTGAIDKVKLNTTEYTANPMNIYDFAGNAWEWTLEHGSDAVAMRTRVYRGGSYSGTSVNPVTSRDGYNFNGRQRHWFPQCALLTDNCPLRKSPRLGLYAQVSLTLNISLNREMYFF